MSDYNKSTNFTTKDTLPSGNSQKLVKGTELDIEFTNIASAIASKANTDSPTFTGTPIVPTASLGTNTTQIASCAFAIANGVPSGVITLWSGSIASIPSGWVLCNGSSGTPDLRTRFVVGAGGSFAVGATGGSADAVVVAHTHTASSTSTVTDPGHSHEISISTSSQLGSDVNSVVSLGGGPAYASNVKTTGITVATATTVASSGSSATNANLPPYYALAYIMKS